MGGGEEEGFYLGEVVADEGRGAVDADEERGDDDGEFVDQIFGQPAGV